MIGGMILLPFALRQVRKDKLQISRSSILHIGSLGILNVCVSMLLLQLSIFYGKASLTAVIVSMNPLFVTGFAMVLIKEKLNRIQLLSLGLGLLGLLLIVFSERDFANSSYLNLPVGVIFAIMASLTFGLWTVLTKSAIVRYGNVFTNALSFLFGGIILMLINLIIGKPAAFSFSMRNLLLVSYLGLFITGVAYLLYFDAMKAISASVASAYFFLKPALATLLAFFILKETLSMWQLVGITLIVVSLVWRPLTNIFSYIRYQNSVVA